MHKYNNTGFRRFGGPGSAALPGLVALGASVSVSAKSTPRGEARDNPNPPPWQGKGWVLIMEGRVVKVSSTPELAKRPFQTMFTTKTCY